MTRALAAKSLNDGSRVYWIVGLVSAALHGIGLVALMEWGVLFSQPAWLEAHQVRLVSIPDGFDDPLARMAAEPEVMEQEPGPVPEPAPEAEVEPEPPKAPEQTMRDPNRAKVVKSKPTPTARPRRRPPVQLTPRQSENSGKKALEVSVPIRRRRGIPGGFQSSGSMIFDNESFNFAYYATSVQQKLSNNFVPPPTAFQAGRSFGVVVHFVIGKNGKLLALTVQKPSGFPPLDQAAQRAVLVSNPFPPLPLGFSGMELGVTIKFECSER